MKKYLVATLVFLAVTQNNFAEATQPTSLYKKRLQVVSRYLTDLEKANYQDITQLFINNGTVVSTSKGKIAAKDFFYDFLPNIATATVTKHQQYAAKEARVVATRFYFTFVLKNGEQGAGEYVDEFIFAPSSDKLSAVYMFENKFFPKD